jgi:hypothetical protein
MSEQQPLYKRLGLAAERVAASKFAALAEQTKAHDPKPYAVYWHKSDLVGRNSWAAFTAYLEEDYSGCIFRAKETVSFALDLFLGTWRESVANVKQGGMWPAEHWRKQGWITDFRMALLWSACLEDWSSFDCICKYPNEQTIDDSSERKSEAPWYQLLAACGRGEGLERFAEAIKSSRMERSGKEGSFEQLIEQDRSKRLKLLTAALRAIESGDNAEVQKRIDEYLAYYRKNEFTRRDVEDKLTVDGTILVHLAEHKGLTVNVAPTFVDHIIRLPRELIA